MSIYHNFYTHVCDLERRKVYLVYLSCWPDSIGEIELQNTLEIAVDGWDDPEEWGDILIKNYEGQFEAEKCIYYAHHSAIEYALENDGSVDWLNETYVGDKDDEDEEDDDDCEEYKGLPWECIWDEYEDGEFEIPEEYLSLKPMFK